MKNKKTSKPASVWQLSRPKSVKGRIIEAILSRIADGHLRIGASLPPEAHMCKELGVSRVVFREAVKQLEALGFLRIDRGNGTIVSMPDFRCLETIIEFLGQAGRISFKELHEFRTLIEVEAVRLVAEVGDAHLVERLAEILRLSAENVDKEIAYVDLDLMFHKEILDACPNRLTAMMLSPFDAYLRKSRGLSFTSIEGARSTIETHRRIMEAIREKNPAEAARRMADHLAATAKDLGF